jgi:hypothetical protein
VSVLSSLPELTGLQIYNNQITDITPLSALKQLRYLVTSDNPLADLSPLSDLTELRENAVWQFRNIHIQTPRSIDFQCFKRRVAIEDALAQGHN